MEFHTIQLFKLYYCSLSLRRVEKSLQESRPNIRFTHSRFGMHKYVTGLLHNHMHTPSYIVFVLRIIKGSNTLQLSDYGYV